MEGAEAAMTALNRDSLLNYIYENRRLGGSQP
jgi:hypothetical protein